MRTFKDEFDGITAFIEEKGMSGAFDNVMGLVTLDRMVDVLVQTPELQASIHAYLRDILKGMMDFEYPDKVDESMLGYVR